MKDAKTAKSMLKTLEDVFERKNVFSRLHLKKKLLSLKCGPNDRLEDHFLKFDLLIRESKNSDTNKLEEIDKVCHLLLTMPDKFNTVITATETMNESKLTIDFVKSRLLDEELKLIKRKSETKSSDKISFKTTNFNCYKCGKYGHRSIRKHFILEDKDINVEVTNVGIFINVKEAHT